MRTIFLIVVILSFSFCVVCAQDTDKCAIYNRLLREGDSFKLKGKYYLANKRYQDARKIIEEGFPHFIDDFEPPSKCGNDTKEVQDRIDNLYQKPKYRKP